jgi:hypothetical protein
MRYGALIFAAIGLCAIGAALAQPEPLSPQAQRMRIQAAMESRGYAPSGRADIGKAVTIMKFSSPGCDGVRVLPVSVLFQETALLRQAESAGDQRTFIYRDGIYRNGAWKDAARGSVALAHLSEQFLQMVRVTPDPAIDTMLYVVAPGKCGPTAIDWAPFWSRKPAV